MKIQEETTNSSNTQCKIKESKLSTCRGAKPNGLYIYENALNSVGVRKMENKATVMFKPISLEKREISSILSWLQGEMILSALLVEMRIVIIYFGNQSDNILKLNSRIL